MLDRVTLALPLLLVACSHASSAERDAGAQAGADAATAEEVEPEPDEGPLDLPHGGRLMLSAPDLDFGTVVVGAMPQQSVVVTNNGDAMTAPLIVTVSPAGDFAPVGNCMGAELGPQETCVVTVTFQPGEAGTKMAEVGVAQTAGDTTPVRFTVHGVARPAPDASPDLPRDAGADSAADAAPDAPTGG